MNDFFSQPVDKDALRLTHAIALKESGNGGSSPNYNAIGDNGTSHGAYQWQPGNFESAAKESGLNPTDLSPENQDKVAYYQVKKYKDQGLDPGQIASKWNSGSPDNWKDHKGTTIINGKPIEYDTPAYVKGVQEQYNKLLTSEGGQTNQSPQTSSDTTNQNADNQSEQQPGLLQRAGNFLFPIVGDVKDIIQGKNTKKAGQIFGDLALSALPFIPGLGEVGEAARGGEALAEGGAALAKGAESSGLVPKMLATKAGRGAVTGYGAGVASGLSQGKSLGESLTPNTENILGAATGGIAPSIIEHGTSFIKSLAGINPQVANEMANGMTHADIPLKDEYVNVAKTHANKISPSTANHFADHLDEAAAQIDQKAKEAGMAVNAANKASANVPIQPQSILPLTQSLNESLDHFGVKVVSTADGKLSLKATRAGGIELTPVEKNRVLDIAKRLKQAASGGNVRTLDDLMATLDKKHDYGITGQDPLNGVFGQLRHQVNEVARTASPEFATANDRLSQLRSLQNVVRETAGNKLQRAELLMKRVFSDSSKDSLDLFNQIKNETGVDLRKHAALAKFAIDAVGSDADKSFLANIIKDSTKGNSNIVGSLINAAKEKLTGSKNILGVIPNPANAENVAEKLMNKSKPGLIPSLLRKGAVTTGIRTVTGS